MASSAYESSASSYQKHIKNITKGAMSPFGPLVSEGTHARQGVVKQLSAPRSVVAQIELGHARTEHDRKIDQLRHMDRASRTIQPCTRACNAGSKKNAEARRFLTGW